MSCLDSGKLNNDPVGKVNMEYIMLYNKMKCTPDLLPPKISSIIEDLMTRYSRWEFIKNVLARVFYFADAKLNNFQEAQEKAEKLEDHCAHCKRHKNKLFYTLRWGVFLGQR